VPRRATYGTRIVLDVSQYWAGIATSRTVRIRVGAARRGARDRFPRRPRLPREGVRRPRVRRGRGRRRPLHRHPDRAGWMELRPCGSPDRRSRLRLHRDGASGPARHRTGIRDD
jgi:hypothetical protein